MGARCHRRASPLRPRGRPMHDDHDPSQKADYEADGEADGEPDISDYMSAEEVARSYGIPPPLFDVVRPVDRRRARHRRSDQQTQD